MEHTCAGFYDLTCEACANQRRRQDFVLGEERYSSAGNIYRLEAYDGKNRCGVRRIGIVGRNIEPTELWDNDSLYYWNHWQWDSLPLVGAQSDDPSFGIFTQTRINL